GSWAHMIPGSGTQTRSYTTINHWSPFETNVARGLFSLASSQSFWKFGYNYSYTDTSLTWWSNNTSWEADTAFYGENIIRCFGLEAQAGATNNLGIGTPFAGNVLNSVLYRIDYEGPTIAWWDSLADDNDSLDGYGPYTIRAVITDFSGIDSAALYYTLTGAGKDMPYATMTKSQSDTFSAVIPDVPLAAGDTAYFDYHIKVWDHANSSLGLANYTTTTTRTFKLRNLPTGLAGDPAEANLPKSYALQGAYPNPSRGQTVVKYQLPKASNVQLQVYNVAGQLVKTVSEGQKPAGYHQVKVNDNTLSNGIYFYKLTAGEFSATRKLVVLK
ncbi:MAG: T9SS type A sorting domain-containing protein, partial [Saprospiraceae bacterium]|nr:T9SS type A sorting domain-containing protein [Saprospiraceae bacterium]